MAGSRLSDLQIRILELLSDVRPPWTLVGGAALAGFHLGHRATRDLDLFFRPRDGLGDLTLEVRTKLTEVGFGVADVRKTRDFSRLRVSSSEEVVILDLVSEQAEPPLPPEETRLGDVVIRVASTMELLASKLCTLMTRAEIRDLVDVRALVESGTGLVEAMKVAPLIDGGFSPLTLSWVLRDLDVRKLARASGLDPEEAQALSDFGNRLIGELLQSSRPE